MKTAAAGHTHRTARGSATSAALIGVALLTMAGCSGGSPADPASGSAGTSFTTREVTDGTTTFTVVTNPGDRPVLSYGTEGGIVLLTEEADGQAFAFTQSVFWGINAFDQWGVELGKVMANQLAPKLTSTEAPAKDSDASTDALIERYRAFRGR